MPKKGFILWLFTETPLHAGVGSGLGDIDLPLQRERTTGLPYIQASSVKGALRAFLTQQGADPLKVKALFGPDTEGAHEHAGALALSDARLLLFPVRSLAGVWAWITSPFLLSRLERDIKRFSSNSNNPIPDFPSSIDKPYVSSESEIILNAGEQKSNLILEDMVYEIQRQSIVEVIADKLKEALPEGSYWQSVLGKHLAILPDEELQFFAEHATEVITRVRIDQETKTVQEGALWTEELLPSETLLYVMGVVEDAHKSESDGGQRRYSADELYEFLKGYLGGSEGKCIQIGGDSTLGRGWCHLKLQEI
ncbi:MAG: type III-B CRISPR module RAMP protein Cmr4 [Aquificaceae bacterium]|nr:type III-B CRISPR module RAMP protein Cmr4 [Aquificaceae bacterium]